MEIPPYVYEAAHDVVADFAEFSGRPLEELARDLDDFRRLAREEWDRTDGATWTARAERYYGLSRHYVLDLLRVNTSKAAVLEKLRRFEPRVLDGLLARAGGRFAEFGGGTGVFCEIMADAGMDVTYVDLPGLVSRFAAWRFAKYGIRATVVHATPRASNLPGTFDALFSDAVFEHLVDPEATARDLARHLAPGGFFGLLVDLEGENPDLPMHRRVDIEAVHAALASEGLRPQFGRGTFASGWTR